MEAVFSRSNQPSSWLLGTVRDISVKSLPLTWSL